MLFNATLGYIQQSFAAEYEVSSTIRHKGEKGRQREFGLGTLLREHLPTAYGVGTGEILPYKGDGNSPQCDIIIYDQLHYPVMGRNKAVQLIPLEAVFCVIEVRSILNSEAIKDADDKFRSILRMPRCKSQSRRKKGMRREPFFATFGFEFCTTHDTVWKYQHDVDYEYAIVALDTGIGLNLTIGNFKEKPIWVNSTDKAQGRFQTLAWFYFVLLENMRQIDLGTPNYSTMFLHTDD